MSTQHWANIAPDSTGARGFHQQMVLDRTGVLICSEFLKKNFKATVLPANKRMQLRGVDICSIVNTGRFKTNAVGIDIKADSKESGNLTLEIVSSDRGNSLRLGMAAGWIFKESSQVAYLFLATGESLFLDMEQVFPWVLSYLKRVIEFGGDLNLTPSSWISATPNPPSSKSGGFLSYNIVLPIKEILEHCPGVTYVDISQQLGADQYEALSKKKLAPRLLSKPPSPDFQLLSLAACLKESNGYVAKEQLSQEDLERIVRAFSRRVRFSKVPAVKDLGESLKASRMPLTLPEDRIQQVAVTEKYNEEDLVTC